MGDGEGEGGVGAGVCAGEGDGATVCAGEGAGIGGEGDDSATKAGARQEDNSARQRIKLQRRPIFFAPFDSIVTRQPENSAFFAYNFPTNP